MTEFGLNNERHKLPTCIYFIKYGTTNASNRVDAWSHEGTRLLFGVVVEGFINYSNGRNYKMFCVSFREAKGQPVQVMQIKPEQVWSVVPDYMVKAWEEMGEKGGLHLFQKEAVSDLLLTVTSKYLRKINAVAQSVIEASDCAGAVNGTFPKDTNPEQLKQLINAKAELADLKLKLEDAARKEAKLIGSNDDLRKDNKNQAHRIECLQAAANKANAEMGKLEKRVQRVIPLEAELLRVQRERDDLEK